MCQRCSSCQWMLVGTTAYGQVDCATPGYPAVYMKVDAYAEWINETINEDGDEEDIATGTTSSCLHF